MSLKEFGDIEFELHEKPLLTKRPLSVYKSKGYSLEKIANLPLVKLVLTLWFRLLPTVLGLREPVQFGLRV